MNLQRSATFLLLLAASLYGAMVQAQSDTIIYGANAYGNNRVIEVNLTQSTAIDVGGLPFGSQAIAQDPVTGYVYFYEWRTFGDEFAYWDPETGSSTIVRTYAPRQGFYAKRMDFAPDGTLYLMDDAEGLYTIDKLTGDTVFQGTVTGLETGPYAATGDMAFAPDGALYVVNYRSLYSIDIPTLSSTLLYTDMIGIVPPGAVTVWTGVAWCDGLLYASYVEQALGLAGMFSIDPANGDEQFLYYTSAFFNDLTSCSTPPPNQPPVADDQAVSTVEDTPTVITLTAADGDGDPLSFNIVAQPGSGSLSGSGDTYTYTPNGGFAGIDSFDFVANDGRDDSNVATVTVDVTPAPNHPPVADDQSVSTLEDTPVQISLTASDGDGDPLTFSIVSQPSSGLLSGSGDSYTYTPSGGFTGIDSFDFRASDGQDDSNLATVTIDVTPAPNQPPVADNQAVSTVEDTPIAITLTASDGDGDPLNFSIVTQPASGLLSGSGDTYTYTPNSGFDGVDSFGFLANDGEDDSNVATVTVTVTPGPNQPPVADDQAVSTVEDTPITITLTASDGDGDPLTFNIDSQPASGSLSGSGDTYTYTPNGGFVGVDSFGFLANDGEDDSNLATVTIDVTPAPNQPPVADNQAVSTVEDTPITITLTASDGDGDPLTFNIDSQPASGSLSGSGDTYTYTPNGGFVGVDSFDFLASDGEDDSNLATVTIDVTPTPNQPPVADNQAVSTVEDTPIAITLTASDGDSDPLTYSIVAQPASGSLSGSGDTYTYTPNTGFDGADSFDFLANDGEDDSNVATVTITVTPGPNQPPVADDQAVTTVEDTPVMITLTATDGDGDPLNFSIVSQPASGSLSGSGDTYTYTPNGGFVGTDSFDFQANDSEDDSNVAMIIIDVTPAPNQPPTANNLTVSTELDTPIVITLTASDGDGDPLTYSVVSQPSSGSLSGSGDTFTYSPNSGFVGTDSFDFQASDGEDSSNVAMVIIDVTPPPDTIIYGANAYGNNRVIEVNLTQSTAIDVGGLPFGSQAIAQDPVTGYVYFYEWRTFGDEFAYWDPETGSSTIVRTYAPRQGFYAKRMDFAPDGTLYLMDDAEGLYTIDKLTGDTVFQGTVTGLETGPYAATGDMAFAPDGALYVVNYRSLYSIDIPTLSSTLLYTDMIGIVPPGAVTVWTGVAWCDGLLYASYVEQALGLAGMFSIDPANGDEQFLYYTSAFFNDLTSCSVAP